MEIDSYYILCPYCQSQCDTEEAFREYDPFSEPSIDCECEECGKKFECRQVMTIDYRTEKDCKLNGEECVVGKYHCENCDSYDVNVEQKLKKEKLEIQNESNRRSMNKNG